DHAEELGGYLMGLHLPRRLDNSVEGRCTVAVRAHFQDGTLREKNPGGPPGNGPWVRTVQRNCRRARRWGVSRCPADTGARNSGRGVARPGGWPAVGWPPP